MEDLAVIEDQAAAVSLLDPTRTAILGALAEPGSATTVAATLGLTRQKTNYHLRAMEAQGLVALVEERPRRGLTERVMVASARSYVLSPEVLGPVAADPERADRLSSRYLIAVAARLVAEVAQLVQKAEQKNLTLATLAIDTELRFATAADRAAFTDELASSVTSLVAKYHDENAPKGRWHRLVVAAHPKPIKPTKPTKPTNQEGHES